MTNSNLNKLCMDANDPMLKAEVRCKHGILLQMQTSWSDRNPGRRFWSCPHYEPTNCKFFKWRDKDSVDERSKFIIPRLVNKMKELEENYERVKMQLDKLESFKMHYDNLNMNSLVTEDSKEKEILLDEVESLQLKYENLNINSLHRKHSNEKVGDAKEDGDLKEKACDAKEKVELKEKSMKMEKKKRMSCRFSGKFFCSLIICLVVVYVSFVIQIGNSKKNQRKLP